MKRVYCAGAYSGDNVIDVLQNIGKGQRFAAEIFRMGFAVFSPWSDADFVIKLWNVPKEELPVSKFYKYSLTWLAVCDIMFVVPGWENSAGTLKEIEIAKEMGIPIVYGKLTELEKYIEGEN